MLLRKLNERANNAKLIASLYNNPKLKLQN